MTSNERLDPTFKPRKPLRSAHPGLLPTLFDRLTDNAPSQASEAPTAYTLTAAGLCDNIRRDLAHLLGATNAGDLIDRDVHALAADSCINFGVPPIAGGPVGSVQWPQIESRIRQAVAVFEPRLLRESVAVEPLPEGRGTSHMPRFRIRAQVAAQPYPLEFTVQSAVDLESRRLLTATGPAGGLR